MAVATAIIRIPQAAKLQFQVVALQQVAKLQPPAAALQRAVVAVAQQAIANLHCLAAQ